MKLTQGVAGRASKLEDHDRYFEDALPGLNAITSFRPKNFKNEGH